MLTFDLELSHGPNSQPASTITPSNTSASSRTLRTHPDTLRLQTERQELELFKPSRFISRYNVLQLPFGPQANVNKRRAPAFRPGYEIGAGYWRCEDGRFWSSQELASQTLSAEW
ncbi:uncharacterized [Tachysurus ichikawai]